MSVVYSPPVRPIVTHVDAPVALPGEDPPPPAVVDPGSAKPSTEQCERLILALPMDDGATNFRYGVVALPETYLVYGVAAAARVFDTYLVDPTPEHIILRQRIKNREDEWVWASIDPMNWKRLIKDNDQVGIFKNGVVLENFLHGEVFISY
ncbi:hypothetical protein D9758_007141 [Tetrapyrgos nigripes]|uniref:Uncharacterized protein n=1 Tax=Tetrapyrgos nigripes TaxID=182062 RepID=A0A8H5GDJ8_9AGAR|nr:hypothetical protein D9758_007141 [Tetrapyrgos nigripes]